MSSDDYYPCKKCGKPLRLSTTHWVNEWYCPECNPFFDDVDEDFCERLEDDDE